MDVAFLDALDSREDATLIWLGIAALLVAVKVDGFGGSLVAIVRAFASWKLLALFGSAAAYCAVLILVASEVGLWHTSALRETLYWFFLTGVVLTGNAVTAPPAKYVRPLVRQAVSLTVGVEFLVNLYVFPLAVELVLLPLVALLLALVVVASRDPKHADVHRLVDGTIAVIGWGLLLYVGVRLASDFDGFLTRQNGEAFLVAPVLTLAFLPFCLAWSWISKREQERLRKRFRPNYGRA